MQRTIEEQREAHLQLQEFHVRNPEVIIKYPATTPSGLWEVSLPGQSCVAFDSICLMMPWLLEKYPEPEEEGD